MSIDGRSPWTRRATLPGARKASSGSSAGGTGSGGTPRDRRTLRRRSIRAGSTSVSSTRSGRRTGARATSRTNCSGDATAGTRPSLARRPRPARSRGAVATSVHAIRHLRRRRDRGARRRLSARGRPSGRADRPWAPPGGHPGRWAGRRVAGPAGRARRPGGRRTGRAGLAGAGPGRPGGRRAHDEEPGHGGRAGGARGGGAAADAGRLRPERGGERAPGGPPVRQHVRVVRDVPGDPPRTGGHPRSFGAGQRVDRPRPLPVRRRRHCGGRRRGVRRGHVRVGGPAGHHAVEVPQAPHEPVERRGRDVRDGRTGAARCKHLAVAEGGGGATAAGIDVASVEEDRERRADCAQMLPIGRRPWAGGSSWQSRDPRDRHHRDRLPRTARSCLLGGCTGCRLRSTPSWSAPSRRRRPVRRPPEDVTPEALLAALASAAGSHASWRSVAVQGGPDSRHGSGGGAPGVSTRTRASVAVPRAPAAV